MKTTSRHTANRCLFMSLLWCGLVVAAVPEVDLASDPVTSLHCPQRSLEILRTSGATTSAAGISGNGVSLYQAAFNPDTWSGSLRKYHLGFDSLESAITIASAAEWDAADILTGSASVPAKPAPDARHIYTLRLETNRSTVTIPLVWSSLSAAQKTSLNISPVNGIDDQSGEKRLDYLRGGRQYELGKPAGIFRARYRVLGAIVHSTPVFVGLPTTRLQGDEYKNFYDANKDRKSVVYVGAADGMLHAFDALSGEELFAYVPQAIFKNLNNLVQQPMSYRPLVDGAITVAETRVGNQWRTILASGMGAGAQGVFALDVTAPDQFEQGLGALWEFTDTDDMDIGSVVSAPLIARFKVKIVKGVASYRDFVVVAGGLNSYRDDGAGKFNLQAPGALFLLALDKAKSEPWKIGSNYFKFIIPVSDKNSANGLFAPTLALADDGTVNLVYAGDLQGNVWRFDFSGSAPWSSALGTHSAKPFFTATDEQHKGQPITQQIQVVYAPYAGYLLLFGTGKFMEAADLDGTRYSRQSFYGILDAQDGKTVTRSQLIERKLTPSNSNTNTLQISGAEVRYGIPVNGDKGWYFDFLESNKTGERSISSALVIDGSLFFNTLIPNTDPCQKPGGRSYVLNVLTGLAFYADSGTYLTGSSVLSRPLVISIAQEPSMPDATGKRPVKKKLEVLDPASGNKLIDTATGDNASAKVVPKVKPVITTIAGRLSWREIVNWMELRTSATKK